MIYHFKTDKGFMWYLTRKGVYIAASYKNIANMPENYDDYIERMDSAVEAYMRRTGMPDEEVFELRRPDSGLKY